MISRLCFILLISNSETFDLKELSDHNLFLKLAIRKGLNRGLCNEIRGGTDIAAPTAQKDLESQRPQTSPFYPSVFDEEDPESIDQIGDPAVADRLFEKGAVSSDDDEEGEGPFPFYNI